MIVAGLSVLFPFDVFPVCFLFVVIKLWENISLLIEVCKVIGDTRIDVSSISFTTGTRRRLSMIYSDPVGHCGLSFPSRVCVLPRTVSLCSRSTFPLDDWFRFC